MSSTGNVFGMGIILPQDIDIYRRGGIIGNAQKFDISRRGTEAVMSRAQLALNVDSLDEGVAFYSKLFNTSPAKVKPGYANFAVAQPPLKLVLIENPGRGGTLNHLGVEVESSDAVHAEIARLSDEGMFTEEEIGTKCCFAIQDKVWVTGPAGEKWEVYTVLADSDTFGINSDVLAAEPPSGCSCDSCETGESAPDATSCC